MRPKSPLPPPARRAADDYARIARVIEFLRTRAPAQPDLATIAGTAGLSPFHLQRLFTRWAGLSPKQFLQTLAVGHAKTRLRASADVLSAAWDAGLSGPGRLHDLFVTLEAVTPGEFKRQGAGVRMGYGFHPTPFGECFVATTARGVCGLEFVAGRARGEMLDRFRAQWPGAELAESAAATAGVVRRIFGGWSATSPARPDRTQRAGESRSTSSPMRLAEVQAAADGTAEPLRVLVRGTNFQVQVWRALLRVPPGAVTSYGAVARAVGRPRAVRAVGTAVGANPVAFLIPCHRVLRGDGALGGYRWGDTRKAACLLWEEARGDPMRSSAGCP